MNFNSPKQRIFIGIGIFILFFIVVSSLFLITSGKGSSEADPVATETHDDHFHGGMKPDTTPLDPRTDRVFVKDLHELEESIDEDTRKHIEIRLYKNAVNASKNDAGLYTGSIQPESYTKTPSDNSTIIKFLVDIEPARLTYEVSIVYRNNGNAGEVYVACAAEEQQMSESTICKQGVA